MFATYYSYDGSTVDKMIGDSRFNRDGQVLDLSPLNQQLEPLNHDPVTRITEPYESQTPDPYPGPLIRTPQAGGRFGEGLPLALYLPCQLPHRGRRHRVLAPPRVIESRSSDSNPCLTLGVFNTYTC